MSKFNDEILSDFKNNSALWKKIGENKFKRENMIMYQQGDKCMLSFIDIKIKTYELH